MDRDTLDLLDKETLIRLILSQAEAIERLTREVEALRADNAALRAKPDLPPKTPENSNTPPSQGHKASGEESKTSEGKRRKPHAGAHRPLHPNPTAKRGEAGCIRELLPALRRLLFGIAAVRLRGL